MNHDVIALFRETALLHIRSILGITSLAASMPLSEEAALGRRGYFDDAASRRTRAEGANGGHALGWGCLGSFEGGPECGKRKSAGKEGFTNSDKAVDVNVKVENNKDHWMSVRDWGEGSV